MGVWQIARNVASILAHDPPLNECADKLFDAPLKVFLDGIGTEWRKESLDRFPYILLTPAQTQTGNGSASHTIRAVVAIHAGLTVDASKTRQEEDGVRIVGRGEDLDRLVALVRRAVFDGFPDSVPEAFTADFDLVNQYPVQSAELTFELQDQFAFDNP